MSECYCDYETPSVFRLTTPTAIKQHLCGECGRTIKPSETYKRIFGVWGGDARTFKVCDLCEKLFEYTRQNVPCFCLYYGGEAREEALEELRHYAHELPGLWFGGARLYVKARQLRLADKGQVK